MSNSIYGTGDEFLTPDGRNFGSRERAIEHCISERNRIGESIGRTLTDSEWRNQKLPAAFDSRTHDQKAADESFKVKLSKELSPLQSAIANAEADVENSKDRYKGMSREEARLYDLKRIQAREAEQAEQAKSNRAHLKAIEPKLTALDQLIDKEKWSTNSDAGFREQLRQARETLLEPNHDPQDVQKRFADIDQLLLERKANRQSQLLQQREALENQLAAVDSEVGLLSEPEMPKTEHVPNPHGYPDPMADFQPSESEPELPRASIDTGRNIRQQIADLLYEATMQDWPLECRKEILEAQQQFKSGNEVPALETLAKYVE